MTNKKKSSKKIHISLCNKAAAITILILELCFEFDIDFIGWLNASGIFLYILKILALGFRWLLFNVLYQLMHAGFRKAKKYFWKKETPECNIEGAWLHIHEKESVRIGVADITQDFYDITIRAENVHPHSGNNRITTWHYVGTEFRPDDTANIKLMGCYFAHRQGDESKQGVHLFTNLETKDGKVWKMKGDFGDALKVNAGEIATTVGDQTGKIHFFRMTPEIKRYINYKSVDEYDQDKLIWIMNEKENPDVFNSEFVKTLKKAYNKATFQKDWKSFKKRYSSIKDLCEISLDNIELAVYNLIAYSMYADNRLDCAETAMLSSLTGLSPDLEVLFRPKKDQVFENIKNILRSFHSYPAVLTLFKSILCSSCRSIILSNLEETNQEETLINELESIMKEFV